MLALGNATYLFSRYKTYDMQLRSVRTTLLSLKMLLLTKQAQDPIRSPHASPVAAPRSRKRDGDTINTAEEPGSRNGKLDGKKVALALGRALWLTVKFVV
jgi:hypothetical protein